MNAKSARASGLRTLAMGLELALSGVKELLDASDPDDWVDQKSSPLGRRRHCAAVRRGELPGRKVNGQVLVRRRDLDEYIDRHRTAIPAETEGAAEAAEAEEILNFTAPRRRKAV